MSSFTPSTNMQDSSSALASHCVAFPKTGVKISILQELRSHHEHSTFDCFIDYHDPSKGVMKDKPFAEMTTTDVCEMIIKPLVRDYRCSYCDYLRNVLGRNDCVGVAQVFISHAWKYTFVDVISSLEYHFVGRDPNILIWFDLFSNNQIIAPALDFIWWSSTFKSAIEDFGYVVVICLPWSHPEPFRRAWCLFEVYCAIVTNSRFEVAMSASEHDSFLLSIVDDIAEYYNMLGNIQVESSECWKDEDKLSIFAFVQTLPDKFNTVNSLICDRMRSWVPYVLSKEIAANDNDEELKADLKAALGSIHAKQGHFDDAIQVLDEALAVRIALNDGEEEGVKVANIYYRKASVRYSQGKYDDSLACSQRALYIYVSEQGEDHKDVAMVCNIIGLVLSSQGEASSANEQYSRALAIYERVYGSEHTSYLAVADVYNNAAANHSNMREHELALKDYQQVLTIRKSKLGEDHPDVANTYNCMGNVYMHQLKQQEALNYYEMSLTIRRSKLGEDHPFVGQTYNNLGNTYRSLKQYSTALQQYKKALDIRKAKLDEDHPDIAATMNNMALVYVSLKQFDKAFDYYTQALEIRKAKLGEKHPSVASTMNNIGNAYRSNNDHQTALGYFEQALSIRKDLYGENHMDVAQSLANVGNCYRSLSQYESALECYSRALTIREDKLGSDDMFVAATLHSMAIVYDNKGSFEHAISHYERALTIRMKDGARNDSTVQILKDMGLLYKNNRYYDDAIERFEKVLAIYSRGSKSTAKSSKFNAKNKQKNKQKNGENSEECASVYLHMGQVYHSQFKYEMAMTHYSKSLNIYRKLYGADHKDTRVVESRMKVCQTQWDDDQQNEGKEKEGEKEKANPSRPNKK